MDKLCKYKVGEVLGLRQQLEQYEAALKMRPTMGIYPVAETKEPSPLIVVERQCNQCTGGTQTFYTVRIGAGKLEHLNEIEMVPYAEVVAAAVKLAQRPKESR